MATETLILERGNRFGRTAMRFVAVALFALIALGTSLGAADARAVTTTLGQNDFVNACRAGGGTPKRITTHVVQCTTSDGTVVTCDFDVSPAMCTIPFKPVGGGGVVAPVNGGVLALSDPGTSVPQTPIVGQVSTGGVFVQTDPAPSDPNAGAAPADGSQFAGAADASQTIVFVQDDDQR
jgi:hypothetical protein